MSVNHSARSRGGGGHTRDIFSILLNMKGMLCVHIRIA